MTFKERLVALRHLITVYLVLVIKMPGSSLPALSFHKWHASSINVKAKVKTALWVYLHWKIEDQRGNRCALESALRRFSSLKNICKQTNKVTAINNILSILKNGDIIISNYIYLQLAWTGITTLFFKIWIGQTFALQLKLWINIHLFQTPTNKRSS